MTNNWNSMILGDFVTFQRGHDLPEPKRKPGNIPILGSFGITGWHDEAMAKGPGVTIGRSGASFGVVTYSLGDYWPLNTALYVKDFHGNDQKFAYYLLKSLDFSSYNSGSAQPSLNRNHIHPIAINVPPVGEQKAIAHILGSLDDKIELNRRMNATLEAMAQALFKSWFVDFDPVIDNALAAGHPIPEPLQERAEARAALGDQRQPLPEAIRQQFPNRFACNEDMGWVPEGWICTQWRNIAKLEYGKSLKGYRDNEGTVPVYGTNGRVGTTRNALYEKEGIIIGRKGAYRGVHYSHEPFHVIDTAFFLKPSVPMSVKWAYYEIQRFDINGMDSGSAIPSTSREDFYSLCSVFPPLDLHREFDRIVTQFYRRKLVNESGNMSLSCLRDTLLPKLLSGQLRIPEAEQQVADMP